MTKGVISLMDNIVTKLNDATKAYDEGHPIMSDKEWDDLYFSLVDLETKSNFSLPDSPTQKINYQVVSQLNKVEHNHWMGSLDKTKDWDEFLNYFSNINSHKDVIGMIKLDGLTCSLRYVDGKLVSAETRGNGEIGEDILHNALVIQSIPNYISYKEELVLDGEIICTLKDFEEFADDYKNPRNFAAGSIRLLDSKECKKRKLTFVVWNIVEGFNEDNSFSSKLNKVKSLGFIITPYTSEFNSDAKDFLQGQAKEFGYPIDGLVGRFDDISFGQSLGSTEHHAKSAYAFKFYDEIYPTSLINIEWTMGRTGVLTPVAVFEPIDDGESIVERASCHNISTLEELLGAPFKGQQIGVFKANAIIPQIAEAKMQEVGTQVEHIAYPDVCPICGESTKRVKSDSGTEQLICTNPSCEGKLINRLDHFCGKKGLDIKGISKATLEKLLEWGWVNNILDLYSLSNYKSEWINRTGFGLKSVENILEAIENSKDCELASFISAIGIPLIGSTYAKQIQKNEETWEKFRNDVNNHFKFYLWDGFGVEMHSAILNFDYAEADSIAELMTFKMPQPENEELSLKDITICITGKLTQFKNRGELQAKIESLGGKVTGSVSKNTNYLINNDNSSASAKNVAAMKLNIPVVTEQEFVEKFF